MMISLQKGEEQQRESAELFACLKGCETKSCPLQVLLKTLALPVSVSGFRGTAKPKPGCHARREAQQSC